MRPYHSFVANRTAGTKPAIDFSTLKESILGKKYDLSVALVTPKESRTITLRTKHQDKASNVLAFPLSKNSGEIVLCPALARREAHTRGETPRDFLAYLFIHGALHLKGHTHGATMGSVERRILQKFGLHVSV